MKLKETLLNLESSFSWSFFGLIISIFSVGIGIYIGIYYEHKPKIDFRIESKFSALEIKEDIPGLDITYNKTKISKSSTDLKVIKVSVSNSGRAGVTSGLYIDNAPFGFRILHGEVTTTPIITSASNSYLLKNTKISKIENTNSLYKFSNPVLDSNDKFTFKIILTHKKKDEPKIVPIGKIALVKNINFYDLEEIDNNHGFFESALFVSPLDFTGRTLLFGAIFIIFIIIITIFIAAILEYKNKLKRKKLITTYKDYKKVNNNPFDEYRFNLYINNKLIELIVLHSIIKNIKQSKPPLQASSFRQTWQIQISKNNTKKYFSSYLDSLSDKKIITKNEDGSYTLNQYTANERTSSFHLHLIRQDEEYKKLVQNGPSTITRADLDIH